MEQKGSPAEMIHSSPVIPPEWKGLDLSGLKGTLLVIGAPNVGKSTFARYLYQQLAARQQRVAFLDGDPGQTTLSAPTTMTLALGRSGDHDFPPRGRMWQSFVGAVTPAGHMLQVVIGAARLVRAAQRAGVEIIVYDTTGLVNPFRGGVYLKLAKINLLRPTVVFAIQSARELECLLQPLRRSKRVELIELSISPGARTRDATTRQAHRAAQFSRYFTNSLPLTIHWPRLAVLPAPRFVANQLVALEDEEGLMLGLGIVLESDQNAKKVVLYTPVTSIDRVDTLHLGDVVLDPHTFQDARLPKRR
ncbi:MAG: 50S ribosome-binding GTPase [Deltaproteobacteria bacterium]|nr:50S ribosome-binding GTPase [Deltaproteobacteria bacterium]